ncbi:FmdB family zinc ribbon protein [Microbacterium invictum]|uniref:FmdB family regulatory protein n=1 Tax=Microbacterium invictum TaxID=515415 RepID=A0AA40VKJ4_9MICO|nr:MULTISPECIES: FmdB family zinc ribbon protein [Microbacterium]MBB4138556.1 putative FmdB family regulatory protein [Microbacterium invictum]
MPTYAYACTQCGHRFDAVQSFSEPSLTECPQCQGVLRKQYGSIGVTFNGSGFYRTDSRAASSSSTRSSSDSKSSDSTSSDSSSGAAAASSTSSKSEAKASPAPSGS